MPSGGLLAPLVTGRCSVLGVGNRTWYRILIYHLPQVLTGTPAAARPLLSLGSSLIYLPHMLLQTTPTVMNYTSLPTIQESGISPLPVSGFDTCLLLEAALGAEQDSLGHTVYAFDYALGRSGLQI